MGITEWIIEEITAVIGVTGYGGVAFFMMLESMIAPVPSEAVMPFAGFLISEGRMTWARVVVSSTVGSMVGSTLSYIIGWYGGLPLVRRFGKYLLLNEHHLEQTQQFFQRYGQRTIFISRFIPVVRHLISIPAGIGRMPYWRFLLYTTVGAALWNGFLAYVGFVLRSHWSTVKSYTEWLDVVVLAVLAVAVMWFVRSRLRSRV